MGKGVVMDNRSYQLLDQYKKCYPEKFVSVKEAFAKITAGDRIFIATGCGEPQYLVKSLVDYVESHPKAFFDAEILHIWTLGVAPYTDEKFKYNFRHNSFFVSKNTREAVNRGRADYTPVFLSEVPGLFRCKLVPVDVALIQTSLPDEHGYLSLGISVDTVKAAVDTAHLVIAQVNSCMPRTHGETFLRVSDLDYLIPHDQPLLEHRPNQVDEEIAFKIGRQVARIIEDGDTIQAGYGSVPQAILKYLVDKKNLGIHTELLSDGLIELIKSGAVDNRRKEIDRGKTVAAFCMGSKNSYQYLNDNPAIEFKTIDYTNHPLVISKFNRMVAINSALEVDLTGQATAESIGSMFYSGIGGLVDFMRGAALAPGGKTILVFQSTTSDRKKSRIIPCITEGAGVTLTRGDIQYVVTEYGTAFLRGKNIRERAMSLVSIAHPHFRPWLIEEAKKLNLIYKDQAFIPGEKGEYPEHLETYRTTGGGLKVLFRPVKINDEPLIKDFFYSLSDKSLYQRFMIIRRHLPHELLQDRFVIIDYTREMIIVAVSQHSGYETITGLAQYCREEAALSAEVSVVVRDEFQRKGLGTELLSYLAYVAKKQGLQWFVADVLPANTGVFRLLDKLGVSYEKKYDSGLISLKVSL